MKCLTTTVIIILFVFSACASPSADKSPAPVVVSDPTEATSDSPSVSIPIHTDAPSPSPSQIVKSQYGDFEWSILYESKYANGDVNPKIFEVFVDINTSSNTWQSQAKDAFALLIGKYSDYDDVIFKLSINKKGNPQSIVAVWESKPLSIITKSSPHIVWYPKGSGPNALTETEDWEP